MSRRRLDVVLVERGLCDSRSKAQALVMAGKVKVDDEIARKPGTHVREDATIHVTKPDHPFVSRGGVKLQGALEAFHGIAVRGRVCMDVGASTGGFTDCLLQADAMRVHAVDVGYGQLAWKLASDSRVRVLDRQNIRKLDPTTIPEPIELIVVDCSFISLTKILPHLPPLLAPQAQALVLIKPQFEVGRERVGKGGIVRDAQARQDACEQVEHTARSLGFRVRGRCPSPISGRDGNAEFFAWLEWRATAF